MTPRIAGRLRVLAVMLLCAPLLAANPTVADDMAIGSDGAVHRVQVATAPSSGGVSAPALRYTVDRGDGDVLIEFVPGTEDAEPDRQPDLALDPVTDEAVVVWARVDSAGSTIVLRRRGPQGWSAPRILAGPDAAELRDPSVDVRRNLIHVVWSRESAAGSERLRTSLDRESLAVAFGPEWLPTSTDEVVPSSGGEGSGDGLATDALSYFASALGVTPGSSTGDGGTIVVWGIRDEPIPITFREAFRLPGEVQSVRRTEASWIADRLVVWARTASAVHYTLREDEAVWTEFRVVPLDADQGTGDALRMIEEMLLREDEGDGAGD